MNNEEITLNWLESLTMLLGFKEIEHRIEEEIVNDTVARTYSRWFKK